MPLDDSHDDVLVLCGCIRQLFFYIPIHKTDMALSGTISGRSPNDGRPVSFYAARRWYNETTSQWELVFVSAIQSESQPTRAIPYIQTAELGGPPEFSLATARDSTPRLCSFIFWSERAARTVKPTLLFTSAGDGETTYGALMATEELTANPTLFRYIWDTSQTQFKNVVTSSGHIRVLITGSPYLLQCVVGYSAGGGNPYATSPPFLLLSAPVPDATAVTMYSNTGPFTSSTPTWVASIPLPSTAVATADCYFIQFSGQVTVLFNAATDADFEVQQYQAPIASSDTAASAWSADVVPVSTYTNTGGGYEPHALAKTNAGETLVIIRDAAFNFSIGSINASFDQWNPITPDAPDTTITVDYNGGVVLAFGDSRLIWFATAPSKYVNFRVIDCSLPTLTCTSNLTSFSGVTVDLLTYVCTSSDGNTIYVAIGDGSTPEVATAVYIYSYTVNDLTWTQNVVGNLFPSNSERVLDIIVDTIVSSGSALIVAVCETSTLYYEFTFS